MKRYAWALLLAVGAVGCGDDQPTYYKDVKSLVEMKCQGCHVPGGIAPFTLTSYEDLQNNAPKIRNAINTGLMPPWLASKGCADYYGDRSLSDAQIKMFTQWIDAGQVKGDPGDYSKPVIRQTGLTRVDNTLMMPVNYTPQLSPDEYRCFVIDWPYQQDMYVTGFNTKPGNPAIVHHVIAYLAYPENVAEYQALDAADPMPGYTCFGGPGGNTGFPGMIGAWAPGSQGGDFPAGTGIKVSPGSKIILQVHYNTLNSSPVPDMTGVEIKADATVAKPALLMFWTNPDWVQNHTMSIPAGQSDVSYSFATDPTPFLSRFPHSPFTGGKPLTIYSAALHQHLRGTKSRLQINHWSGEQECLLDIQKWNFHWQMAYPFSQAKTFKPGDELQIDCHWDNSQANQPWVGDTQLPARDINWGEGSTDEMCLGALYVTEQ